VRAATALAAVAAVAVVLVVSGCSFYSGTPGQKVHEWASHTSFVADGNQVVGDLALIKKAARANDGMAFLTDCAGATSDIGTAAGQLPTPDQTLTNDLNTAYILAGTATQACSATHDLRSSIALKSLAEIARSLDDLKIAQRRLATFGVKWVNSQL
jgi:hypothetical protein